MHAVLTRYVNKASYSIVLYFKNITRQCAEMNVFTQKFNPITGKNEWAMQPEKYDFHQEVARSSYADMLHDKERNQKYYSAIIKAVAAMKEQGRPANVLDIGTGTGLLSMMAVQAGAKSVIACDAFHPVAKCALAVIRENGFENKIKVIPKRSTELTVGEEGDMQKKANILVTEVFDTELIGEGAIGTFMHALNHLLEPDCIVVPSSATVYAQVIQSHLISNWNKVRPLYIDKEISIFPPVQVQICPGAAAVHDLQMAQLPENEFQALTNPGHVFEFDFTGKTPLQANGSSIKEISVVNNGNCEAIFMWWDLKMDMSGDIILSCAPPWAHPEPTKMQWRDHWMQAIYYLPEVTKASEGNKIQLHSYHDEYSLWFSVSMCQVNASKEIPRPICSCWMHCANSRTRLGMLNDSLRNEKYIDILKKNVTSSTVCLCISDGSLLPLIAAKLGAKRVFAVEPQSLHQRILESYIEANHEQTKIKVINKHIESLTNNDLENEKVDLLIAEPFFNTCLLPWDSLYFWYLRTNLAPLLRDSVTVIPMEATIRAMAVEFEDLWKIRAPVVEAEGFDLSAFDKMVQEAISISDAPVEPHPLWEYRCRPLTSPFKILTFDMSKAIENEIQEASGHQDFISDGVCNGVALWVDFKSDDISITTGPTKPIVPGSQIDWDLYSRQGVYFIQPPANVIDNTLLTLQYDVIFNPNAGHLNFVFKVQEK